MPTTPLHLHLHTHTPSHRCLCLCPPPLPPLPSLLGQVLDKLGLPHLRQLDKAVAIMRQAMLDVIHVRAAEAQ